MEPFVSNTDNSNFDLPPPCPKCGYYATKTLTENPYQEPPSALVRSNYAPSQSECSAIRDLVASSEVLIQTLEAELSSLQAATAVLQSRLSNIQKFKVFQQSLLSPIRLLPDELLAEIFRYYVCQEHVNVGMCCGPLWDVQQVCIRWRDTARTTPSLWNRFEVARDVEIRKAAFTLRIQLCLELTRTLPLSIRILPTPKMKSSIPLHTLEDITKHSDRLVYFKIDRSIFRGSKGSIKAGEMVTQIIKQQGTSLLRQLAIHSCEGRFIEAFQGASALEEVELSDSSIPHPSRFPWSRIKRFTISRCTIGPASWHTFTSALSAMSKSLEELTWLKNRMLGLTQIVTLPLVHTFTIQDTKWIMDSTLNSNRQPELWYYLRVPSLAEIHFIDVEPFTNIRPILSMIRISACVIRRLELDLKMASSFSGDGSFMNIFKGFCDVEELSLIGTNLKYCKDVILDLIWDPIAEPRENLFPSLQKLQLVHPSTGSTILPIVETFSLVEDLMRSRSPSASTAMIAGQTSFTAPLLVMRYRVDLRFRPDFSTLKALGEELGVKVDVQYT